MLIFRLKDKIVIHQKWSIHQVWSWLTWAVCVHRHQSQIKEEQMEAEDYNDSMSPETEDQHSPDTNHHEHDSACQPGFSSSPQSFHCWDPRPSVGPPPSDSQNWQLQLFLLGTTVYLLFRCTCFCRMQWFDLTGTKGLLWLKRLQRTKEGAVDYTSSLVCILNTIELPSSAYLVVSLSTEENEFLSCLWWDI